MYTVHLSTTTYHDSYLGCTVGLDKGLCSTWETYMDRSTDVQLT